MAMIIHGRWLTVELFSLSNLVYVLVLFYSSWSFLSFLLFLWSAETFWTLRWILAAFWPSSSFALNCNLFFCQLSQFITNHHLFYHFEWAECAVGICMIEECGIIFMRKLPLNPILAHLADSRTSHRWTTFHRLWCHWFGMVIFNRFIAIDYIFMLFVHLLCQGVTRCAWYAMDEFQGK